MVILEPKQPVPQRLRLVLWCVAISSVAAFAFLVYLIDDIGFLEEDWGWALAAGIGACFIAEFFLVRHVFMRIARNKPTDA